ncbi:probable G-protein coupled receptor 139 [Narcine bancroftii]|uniref:probable G-protein coupled receptor 139 n=1 Tax=Narcine bancroftii TaxID=1343680 RepID=UPI0038312CB9
MGEEIEDPSVKQKRQEPIVVESTQMDMYFQNFETKIYLTMMQLSRVVVQTNTELKVLTETITKQMADYGAFKLEVKEKFEDVDHEMDIVQEQMQEVNKTIEDLQIQNKNLMKKVDYLENQSRRNNIKIVGLPEGNLITIVILSRQKCGLSGCMTWYLVGMAAADFLVLVTAVILNRISTIYFPVLFLSITPVCCLKLALNYATIDISVWLTVAFTFNRFVAICCPKWKSKYCTKKMAAVIIGSVCSASIVKNIPWYFAYEPLYIVNKIPWFCNVKLRFSIEYSWLTFDWFQRIYNPCVPFFLMLLLNALTVRHILAANKARKRIRNRTNEAKQRDSEIHSRRKSIILLFSISGSFIVLWATHVINVKYVRFSNSENAMGFCIQETGFMLGLLSCCTNTCIYAATQRKFREEFKNVIKYPFKLIFKD